MTHPGYVEKPLDYVAPSRPSVPLPWLGFAVVLGYMALNSIITEYDLHNQQAQLPLPVEMALSIAIGLLCCAAPLLIPGVPRKRRLLALALFASMYALAYVPRALHLPGVDYISFWSTPALYAAAWIAVRHTSRWAFVAVAVAPILTSIFWPFGPLRGGTGQLGGIKPFDLFIAIDLFSFVVPVVAAIVVAGAIAQEVPAAVPGQATLRRWPCWLAVVAFIAALAGVILVAVPTGLPILAIVLGHVASSAVRRKGLGGRSLAITAFILGYAEVIGFLWFLFQALANFKIEF
jgi:Domain of unknown function (DUF4190)